MDSVNRGNGLQNDARDSRDEAPQGIAGPTFRKAHPFAYWTAVGPIALMVGIIIVAALAAIVVLVSMG